MVLNVDYSYNSKDLDNRSVVELNGRLLLKRLTLVRFPFGSNQRLKKLVFATSMLVVPQLKRAV